MNQLVTGKFIALKRKQKNLTQEQLAEKLGPPNPSELLASSAMKNFIDSVSDFFDVVLIDTPPLSAVTDAQILSSYVGGVVLVVRANETKKESLEKTKKILEQVNANILGVILHGVDSSESPSYYYYGVE